MLIFLVLSVSASASVLPANLEKLTRNELVDHLNTHQNLFKAELSDFSSEEMEARAMKKEFMQDYSLDAAEDNKTIAVIAMDVPNGFDARRKWPACPTIGTIYDQASCGSCWAFASANSMSDRYCIASGSTFVFSPADLLSCCPNCGNGCDGGYPLQAFQYFVSTGVVSGGPYGTKDNCKPYQFAPCGQRCSPQIPSTPRCDTRCQPSYCTPYAQDKRYGKQAATIRNAQNAIEYEIMTYGPVAACFDLYEDFYHYKGGVYKHYAGKYLGGHCVKVLGWGVENGVPFWFAANTWSTTYGENGFVRIAKVNNGVNFGNFMMTGYPRV